MANIGEINVTLYWGTKYDSINIPFDTAQIINEATKTQQYNGYYVWQNAYLSQIRLNVTGYQNMLGVQYARIFDSNNVNLPVAWYQILSYQQVSQGCVELGLLFDSLLTISIASWTQCNGILRRWSVNNDNMYRYINTPEPIDLAEPLDIIWDVIEAVPTTSNVAVFGAPYDMTEAPSVITYTNPNGDETNVYYPSLKDAGAKKTNFFSGLLFDGQINTFFTDQLQYNIWNSGQAAYDTYNKAIGLGIDIVVNGYILPSAWVELENSGGYISIMRGKSQTYTPQAPLYRSGLNNAKAGAINTTLTLASCATGDSVTVSNYQLVNSSIIIYSDPYSTGGLRARFNRYLNEQKGAAGWVKSPSWQPLTITSGIGFGTTADTIANTMTADTLKLTQQQAAESIALAFTQAQDKYSYDLTRNTIMGAANIFGSAASGNIGGMLSNGVNTLAKNFDTAFDYQQQYQTLSMRAAQQEAIAANQAEKLKYAGNVGRMAPPSVKFAMARDISPLTYAFSVMTARPSANDAQRIDNFFTAFGYNVDGLLLNTPSQLKTRAKFTFVQADDVRVTQTDAQNLLDYQTIADIQRRFAAGIRIWCTTPDYDYSKSNNII